MIVTVARVATFIFIAVVDVVVIVTFCESPFLTISSFVACNLWLFTEILRSLHVVLASLQMRLKTIYLGSL